MKDHPTNALNRLLDALERAGDLSDLRDSVVHKRQLVEIETTWEISPATDVGSFLSGMMRLAVQNPSIMRAKEPPREALEMMTSHPEQGVVVLNGVVEDSAGDRVLALLQLANLSGGSTVDDLDGDRTIFGIVDTLVAEDQTYSLEKIFLAGFGRAMRRAIKVDDLLANSRQLLGRSLGPEALTIPGPLTVIKAVAIY